MLGKTKNQPQDLFSKKLEATWQRFIEDVSDPGKIAESYDFASNFHRTHNHINRITDSFLYESSIQLNPLDKYLFGQCSATWAWEQGMSSDQKPYFDCTFPLLSMFRDLNRNFFFYSVPRNQEAAIERHLDSIMQLYPLASYDPILKSALQFIDPFFNYHFATFGSLPTELVCR
jgi:hypothetical protein